MTSAATVDALAESLDALDAANLDRLGHVLLARAADRRHTVPTEELRAQLGEELPACQHISHSCADFLALRRAVRSLALRRWHSEQIAGSALALGMGSAPPGREAVHRRLVIAAIAAGIRDAEELLEATRSVPA